MIMSQEEVGMWNQLCTCAKGFVGAEHEITSAKRGTLNIPQMRS
jgi:hypothetical protein